MTAQNQKFLPPARAAQYLNCSKNFLDRDRIYKIHGIPFIRLGKKILYDILDLDAFMQSKKVM